MAGRKSRLTNEERVLASERAAEVSQVADRFRAIVGDKRREAKIDEAEIGAQEYFVVNPQSPANPAGVFLNCLRSEQKRLLRQRKEA